MCNDTLVEIPQVAQMVASVLIKVEAAAKGLALPITVAHTRPELEDMFFVNIIGRGYPSPTNRFRWCTERMTPISIWLPNPIEAARLAVVVCRLLATS